MGIGNDPRLLCEPRTPKQRVLFILNHKDMRKKRFCSGELQSLRDIKAEFAKVRRERETERKAALLCSIQRDFYRSLVSYMEDYVITAAKTEEQIAEAKLRYKSFAQKLEAKYAEEARPFVAELYRKHGSDYTTIRRYEPYHETEPIREAISRAAEERQRI